MSSVDHGHENESAATPADQITVDGSLESDIEIGALPRPDSVNNDGSNYQHHVRSNSVKKPASFKAVSVTKNFLAKAGTPPTPNIKINGEICEHSSPFTKHLRLMVSATATVNGGGPVALAPRPRLVAKTSGTKQSKAHFGSRNGAGPDPMQVWNRNRGHSTRRIYPATLLISQQPHLNTLQSTLPTRNLNSSTVYTSRQEYRQMGMGRRRSGPTSTTMRTTGHRRPSSGTMGLR